MVTRGGYQVRSELLANWTGTSIGVNTLKAFYSYGDMKSNTKLVSEYPLVEIQKYFARHLSRAICNAIAYLHVTLMLIIAVFGIPNSPQDQVRFFLILGLIGLGLALIMRKPVEKLIFFRVSKQNNII